MLRLKVWLTKPLPAEYIYIRVFICDPKLIYKTPDLKSGVWNANMLDKPKVKPYLLDKYDGNHIFTLPGHSKHVTSICNCSYDYNWFISTSADQTIKLWKFNANPEYLTSSITMFGGGGHDDEISSCSLNRHNYQLATSSFDQTVKIWDLNRGMVIRTFLGHTDKVLSVTNYEEEKRILSGSSDHSLRIWDVDSKNSWNNTSTHTGAVTCLEVLRDNPTSSFLSASSTGELIEWDFSNLTPSKRYSHNSSHINSVSVSVDSKKIVVGGSGEIVTVWEAGKYDEWDVFLSEGVTRSVSISPKYYICAVGSEGYIKMYNFGVVTSYRTILPKDGDNENPTKVTALCWSHNSKFLYAGYSDGEIRVFHFTKYTIPYHFTQFCSWCDELDSDL